MSMRFLHNSSLRRAPYDETRQYDSYLSEFIKQVKTKITTVNDDDYLLIIAGPPRTGKSNIGLHIFEEFDSVGCDIKYVAQNRTMFANALKLVKDKPDLRYLDYDEANVNKRDSLSGWNKDMMDLYFAIGGLNIFHVWCNPSIDMLDKAFIEERVKALILVYDKSPKRRVYFFFKAQALLTIFERYGNLKLRTLVKNRHLAYYQGWFREYNGKLKQYYLKQKAVSMGNKVDSFHDKWGTSGLVEQGFVLASDIKKRLDVSGTTFDRYCKELLRRGELVEGVSTLLGQGGRRFIKESCYVSFLDLVSQKQEAEHRGHVALGKRVRNY